jgi:hypothetical protein
MLHDGVITISSSGVDMTGFADVGYVYLCVCRVLLSHASLFAGGGKTSGHSDPTEAGRYY